MKNFITVLLALLFFVASALFFAQNDSMVDIDYFAGELVWQLNWVMIFCVLVGFFLGLGALMGPLLRTKMQLKYAQVKLTKLEKEINSLRSLPVRNDY